MMHTLFLLFLCNQLQHVVISTGCTEEYSLHSQEEPISFLEKLLQPVAFEVFLVDILQKQPAVARRYNPDFYGSFFSVDNIDTILKEGRQLDNPDNIIEYGSNWKLVKRADRNGEFWTGVYSKPNVTVEEAHDAYAMGGFSLIINSVQNLWPGVYKTAWNLEAALGWRVNVNLYMTPKEANVSHFIFLMRCMCSLYVVSICNIAFSMVSRMCMMCRASRLITIGWTESCYS